MQLLKILSLFPPIYRHLAYLTRLEEDIDLNRSRSEVPNALFEEWEETRRTDEYQVAWSIDSPLVSICINTYNRGRLLTERSVRSALAQSYENIEVIVVGDACTDDTQKRMTKINDRRLRFVNLPERGKYPENPEWRWMVAGTASVNHALSLARGHFITHLDDDDEFYPERIAKLVPFIQTQSCDLVWHPFLAETSEGRWQRRDCKQFARSSITTSCVLYHAWLARIPWDPLAWRYREPGDWNRFRKFRYLGVNARRYPELLLRHYRERTQMAK